MKSERRAGGCWREGQTFAGESLLTRYVNFVKLPHTVFALPFALLGVVVASHEHPVTWRVLGLVVLAFTAARFVAMGFNRIADRDLDAKNPRTRGRELPAGRLSLSQAWVAVGIAAALFLWSAWALNPICFRLSPIVLAVVTLYSYSKRFTWWSHLWLGFGDAMAGPAGYLAVSGQWTDPWWLLWMMAAAVTFWIGGFDIFYALQDEAFDRVEGLQSAVVRFGQARGIFVGEAAARSDGARPGGVRCGRRSWNRLLRRRGDRRSDHGLRASAGEAGGPVASERCVLHREWDH